MKGAGLGMLLVVATAVAACSSGGPAASSCQIQVGDAGASFIPQVCREWTGASDQVAARQQDCDFLGTPMPGTTPERTMFSNGPCPRGSIAGGCLITMNGVTYTDWVNDSVYASNPDAAVADVKHFCTTEQGSTVTYVPAP